MQVKEEREAMVSFVGGASYKGGLSSKGFTGPGTYTDTQGFEFTGEFVDGVLEGPVSVFLKPIRATVRLIFKRGRLISTGAPDYTSVVLNCANGNRYTGAVDTRFRRRGQGKLEFGQHSPYEVFEGRFDTDDFEGEGTLVWRDGKMYQGSFSRSKFHGRGKLKTSTNTIDGEFEEGKVVKIHKAEFANGDSYCGGVQDNLVHGKGMYEYQLGHSYKGEFSKGKKQDSKATLRLGTEELKGCVYEGGFQNDKMSGIGTIISPHLNISGTFVDNYLDGKAIIDRKDIGTLEGVYQDNMKHGDFIFKKADSGKQCKTYFQYDVEDPTVHKLSSRF